MAALSFLAVSLLASAAAAPPPRDDPTKYCSNTNTLEEKKRIAEEGCNHLPPHTICHISCLYKSIQVLGKDGRYLESGAADVMAIYGDNHDINPVAMKKAAEACNSVNKGAANGCMRALEVTTCLQREYISQKSSRELILDIVTPVFHLNEDESPHVINGAF